MNWKTLYKYSYLIRLLGNWGVSFFGSLTVYNFVTHIPSSENLLGASATSLVTTMLALCYEARNFGKKE